jgi:hypothetical protein
MAYLRDNFWKDNQPNLFFYPVIFFGIALASINFFNSRSLWFDEVLLAWNIITKSYYELTHPLEYAQVAPVGYLWITKSMVLLLGPGEMALRLFPFLSYLASICLFYVFTVRLTGNKVIAFVAVSLLSLNISALYYSSEVKQYMVELFIALLLVYITVTRKPSSYRSMALFCVLGCLSVYLSLSAVIILASCCFYILYYDIIKKHHYYILWIFLIFACHHLFYYLVFLHNHPTSELMTDIHQDYFISLNPLSSEFWIFLYHSVKGMVEKLLGFGNFWIPALLFSLFSSISLIYFKKYTGLFFLLMSISIHLILSGLRLYPFTDRFLLYLTPFLILIISCGIVYIWEFFRKKRPMLSPGILVIPILVLAYPATKQIPFEREEIKKSLSFLQENMVEGDQLYLYYASTYPFDLYRVTGFVEANPPLIRGEISRDDWGKYLEPFVGMHGRLWLIFSHVYSFSGSDSKNEEYFIVNYLLGKGAVMVEMKKFKGSSVYLVDLGK